MCRAKGDGGNRKHLRCNCDSGETRRSYQRGAHARKKVVNLRHPATGRPVWAVGAAGGVETPAPTPTPAPDVETETESTANTEFTDTTNTESETTASTETESTANTETTANSESESETNTESETNFESGSSANTSDSVSHEEVAAAVVGRDDMRDMTPEQRAAAAARARELYPVAVAHAREAWENVDEMGERPPGTATAALRRVVATLTQWVEEDKDALEKARERGDDARIQAAEERLALDEQRLEKTHRNLVEAEGGEERVAAEREYLHAMQRLGGLVTTAVDAETVSDGAATVDMRSRIDDAAEAARKSTRYPDAAELYARIVLMETNRDKLDGDVDEEIKSLYNKFYALPRSDKPSSNGVYKSSVKRALESFSTTTEHQNEVEAMTRELARFGDFGNRHVGKDGLDVYEGTSPKAVRSVNEALAFFPDNAVDHAWREVGAPVVKLTQARAHFTESGRVTTRNSVMSTPAYLRSAFKTPLTAESMNTLAETIEARKGRLSSDEVGSFSSTGIATAKVVARLKGRDKIARTAMTESTPESRAAAKRLAKAMSESSGMVFTTEEATVGSDSFVYIAGPPRLHRTVVQDIVPTVTTSGTLPTTVHEMSHYIESANPRVGTACKRFVDDRTLGLSRTLGSRSEPQVGDSFIDEYVSREYAEDANCTEVFSMGMEALFTGTHGGAVGSDGKHPADPEHRALVLGMLASLAGGED